MPTSALRDLLARTLLDPSRFSRTDLQAGGAPLPPAPAGAPAAPALPSSARPFVVNDGRTMGRSEDPTSDPSEPPPLPVPSSPAVPGGTSGGSGGLPPTGGVTGYNPDTNSSGYDVGGGGGGELPLGLLLSGLLGGGSGFVNSDPLGGAGLGASFQIPEVGSQSQASQASIQDYAEGKSGALRQLIEQALAGSGAGQLRGIFS